MSTVIDYSINQTIQSFKVTNLRIKEKIKTISWSL